MSSPVSSVPASTLGKHLRHVVDHWAKVLAAAAAMERTDSTPSASAATVLIEYDQRQRDVSMETNMMEAIEALQRVRSDVVALLEHRDVDALLATPVRVRFVVLPDGTEETFPSTLGRELWFAVHHGVHHNALMRVIAKEHGVDIPPQFGLASSTRSSLKL